MISIDLDFLEYIYNIIFIIRNGPLLLRPPKYGLPWERTKIRMAQQCCTHLLTVKYVKLNHCNCGLDVKPYPARNGDFTNNPVQEASSWQTAAIRSSGIP